MLLGAVSPICDIRVIRGQYSEPRIAQVCPEFQSQWYVDPHDTFAGRGKNDIIFQHVPLTCRSRVHIVSNHAKPSKNEQIIAILEF
jgi:hypothetical protein